MKTTKETVYEFVRQELLTNPQYRNGIETSAVASALGMQRSNVSTLLNSLVRAGRLAKSDTRPVIYTLSSEASRSSESSCFGSLIGHNGSLRNPIQLAKAAVLYPGSCLHILLQSPPGCGTTAFASLIYSFAKESGALSADAPIMKVNCRYYAKNISSAGEALFGPAGEPEKGCFGLAKGGMLFIDNFDLLEADQQSKIFTFLETGRIYTSAGEESLDCSDVLLVLTSSPQNSQQISRKIPVTITLPALIERPVQERFALVSHFFSREADNSERTVEVTSESIEGLLLCDFSYNIKELEAEIKSACARAYVRTVDDPENNIFVCLDDFKPHIRKSLLMLKDHSSEIGSMIKGRKNLIYGAVPADTPYRDVPDSGHGDGGAASGSVTNMYANIQDQYQELSCRGISRKSVKEIIGGHLKSLFGRFGQEIQQEGSVNLEQLSRIVDRDLIDLVYSWLEECQTALGRNFRPNIFYGLCLHLNALLSSGRSDNRLSNGQITDMIRDYPAEYSACVRFSSVLKEKYLLTLNTEEIVLLAMFLIEPPESEESRPVVLYAMHGSGAAAALAEVTNALTQCQNAYGYDMSLEISSRQAVEELKNMILRIDNGKGVIVIYDMGSIKTMLDTISAEISVTLRCINIPITLVGIDAARKCSMEEDIEYVFHSCVSDLRESMGQKDAPHRRVIITLCHTGEGGAVQLKNYIDQYSRLRIRTIPLSISNREELLAEVTALRKTYDIHAFVGTYDPKLLGIPFISIVKIFENRPEDLDRILMFEPVYSTAGDYEDIYGYLKEQFHYVSVSKLKTVLPGIIDEFSVIYGLDHDQRLGLFMHLACLTERLMSGGTVEKNQQKEHLLDAFEEDNRTIRRILRPLEKKFKIIIDDNELATMIMIVKKL